MKSYDELKKDGYAFLEHYGVKGMKWRKRKARSILSNLKKKTYKDFLEEENKKAETMGDNRRLRYDEKKKKWIKEPIDIISKNKYKGYNNIPFADGTGNIQVVKEFEKKIKYSTKGQFKKNAKKKKK